MLRNWLTVAVRAFFKNRLFSAINILGLAVGLAACVLILLFVRDELSYDRWIPDAERIYRVHTALALPGRETVLMVGTPGMIRGALDQHFADIEASVRVHPATPVVKRGEEVFYEEFMLADASFFDVLDLPVVSGDARAALRDPSSIIISETMARKYFGDAAPIGRTLTVRFAWIEKEMTVRAVLKDLPHNTHLRIGFLGLLYDADFPNNPFITRTWSTSNVWTYLKLKSGADAGRMRPALPEFEKAHIPDESFGGGTMSLSDMITLTLVNLRDVHLRSKGVGELKPQGDALAVYTFSIVAALILIIACINFTNLSTARAIQRAREVALRKVLGANRAELVAQFLGEALCFAVIALGVALALVEFVLPAYARYLERPLALTYFGPGGIALELAALVLAVGLLSGLYPALYLSRFAPGRILKANKSASTEGTAALRAALVVFQFSVSIALIICTTVVYRQTLFASRMDLGFNPDGLISIAGLGRDPGRAAREAIRDEVARIPGVTAVAFSQYEPASSRGGNVTRVQIPGQEGTPIIGNLPVDYDFFRVTEIPLLAGRTPSREHALDDLTTTARDVAAGGGNVVVSRRALSFFGISDPGAALGYRFRMLVRNQSGATEYAPMTIVGVAEDVQYHSARDPIQPRIYFHESGSFEYLLVRARPADIAAVRDEAERIWRTHVPAVPFVATSVADAMAAQYAAEHARGRMFAIFSGLAIFIACLGLFGLAAFTADRRTKEIGIRKVLGAKVRHIVQLLAWDSSRPVLAANIFAWPTAWWLMRDWLNGFDQRISLDPTIFLLAGTVTLAIALATVAAHALRVAYANPIHALRYE